MTTFKLQIRPLRILDRKFKNDSRWPGKRLRFKLTWTLEIPQIDVLDKIVGMEVLGEEIEGCLARIDKNGDLIWSYPQARSGSYYANIIHCSPALYDRVKVALWKVKDIEKLRVITDNGEAVEDEIIDA